MSLKVLSSVKCKLNINAFLSTLIVIIKKTNLNIFYITKKY